MPVKVFLDTNVIISGLLTDEGTPKIVLDLFSFDLSVIRAVTGQINLLELRGVIERKIPALSETFEDALEDALRRINLEIVLFPEEEIVNRYNGLISYKDTPVIASAVKSGCAYLVTDEKHFETEKIRKARLPVKIVTPLEFLDNVSEIIRPLLVE